MIHDTVGFGLFGTHVIVAVGILLHLLGGLAGVLGDGLVERFAPTDDLASLDVDACREAADRACAAGSAGEVRAIAEALLASGATAGVPG